MDVSNKLILGFVAIIIGAVLIGTIATNGLAVTEKTTVTDEAIDISGARMAGASINETISASNFTVDNPPTSWKVDDCPLTSVVYGNSSTTFTLNTDYNFNTATGLLHVKNTTKLIGSNNATVIDYVYCQDGYLTQSWSRTITNLVAGMFALALLGAGVGIFYSIGKETGIIN